MKPITEEDIKKIKDFFKWCKEKEIEVCFYPNDNYFKIEIKGV